MPANQFDLLVEARSTYYVEFSLTSAIDGSPVDLTGFDVRSQGKKTFADDDPYVFDFVVTMPDAANGRFALALAPLQSAMIEPGAYVYDVTATKDGDTFRLVQGTAVVSPGVTG